jgi:hypothetical protein
VLNGRDKLKTVCARTVPSVLPSDIFSKRHWVSLGTSLELLVALLSEDLSVSLVRYGLPQRVGPQDSIPVSRRRNCVGAGLLNEGVFGSC